MADDPTRGRFTLKRWSQRKHAAARDAVAEAPKAPVAPATGAAPVATSAEAAAPSTLPPVESLTFEADFTAYMKPDIDPSLKRDALKKLFRDPRFNVMDGLDVYIDDYSKPDPLDPEIVKQLISGRYALDPPKTRINERGEVEDVPPEETAEAQPDAEAPPALASESPELPPVSPAVPDPVPEAVPDAPNDDAAR